MATTPIYNWSIPDNTDLVKNGALAIRTLGDAIDTTMATMTPKTIVDAKGDLVTATADNTPARLAVGNNGETLVADSSTSTGLRYQGSMAASKNFVNNGGFDIWQRGTSIAAIANDQAYSADRWKELNNAGLSTYSRQATGDTTNLPFIQYCMRVQRDSGQTATGTIYLTQSLESVNSIPLAGRTVTFSFYARAGANYSATSNVLGVDLNSGTGTDQNINQAFTGSAVVISQNPTLTTTWQRFTYTGTVAATATQLGYYFYYTPTGTAGANDYFEVTGVQLELGSVATTFMRQGGSIAGELATCQRYYYRQTGPAAYSVFGLGSAYTTAGIYSHTTFPVTMRVKPTALEYSNLVFSDGAASVTITSLTLDPFVSGTGMGVLNSVVSGATQFRFYTLGANNNSAGYLAYSAEL